MEVLYYFICSVKDNVPFILSNRANEIIQYLHNKSRARHPSLPTILNCDMKYEKVNQSASPTGNHDTWNKKLMFK